MLYVESMAQRMSKADFDALGVDFGSSRLAEAHGRCEHCERRGHWLFEDERWVGVVCYDGCRGWWSWGLFRRDGHRYHCFRYGFGQSHEDLATQALFEAADVHRRRRRPSPRSVVQ